MKQKVIITVIIIILISTFFFFNKTNKVPVMKIYLKDTNIEEINNNSKKIKYKVDRFITNNKEYKNLTIKGRGNSTWNYIKKPYQIEFNDNKKIVLLANYLDETLIRNHIAFYISDYFNLDYTLKGVNTELYIDNIYQGVYFVVPKIRINKNSINLKNKNSIIMELDNIYFIDDEYYLTKYKEDHLIVKDIKGDNKIINSFIDKYNLLEKAIIDKNFSKVEELIDTKSFAKYYLINHLTLNPDAFRSSFYMYQDGINDKIHAGPIWDFDKAFNNDVVNKEYIKENKIIEESKEINDITYNKSSYIVYELLDFKEFQKILMNIWLEYKDDILEDTLNEIDKQYSLLKDSGNKNCKKWNYPKTYKEYIEELKENITNSYQNLDQKLNQKIKLY